MIHLILDASAVTAYGTGRHVPTADPGAYVALGDAAPIIAIQRLGRGVPGAVGCGRVGR